MMVYKCNQPKRECETCKYEPVCYDSEYIRRLYSAVPPTKLPQAEPISHEDEDS